MRTVFMGTPDFAAGILRAVCEAGYEVAGVVTQPDRPKGRKKELLPGPVHAEAIFPPTAEQRRSRRRSWTDRRRAASPSCG